MSRILLTGLKDCSKHNLLDRSMLCLSSFGRLYIQQATGPACKAAQLVPYVRHVSQVSHASHANQDSTQPNLAYEFLDGQQVHAPASATNQSPQPHVQAPVHTAVLVHGILGSRRNMHAFGGMIVQAFPSWRVLLVDLRCHGDSASLAQRHPRPHSVANAASDVVALLRHLNLAPSALVGHSFGGKVVMAMVQQQLQLEQRQQQQQQQRPQQVWVLDSLPGEVRTGGSDGSDHPGSLIRMLSELPTPIGSRGDVVEYLREAGFSDHIARWVATNLRPASGAGSRAGGARGPAGGNSGGAGSGRLYWTFDLEGIQDLYTSYEATSLWPLLLQPPAWTRFDFVRAAGSTFRWAGDDEARLRAAGHRVHMLRDAGHWVHTDNPSGLLEIMAPTFQREEH